jgi:hypothetical protein
LVTTLITANIALEPYIAEPGPRTTSIRSTPSRFSGRSLPTGALAQICSLIAWPSISSSTRLL